MHTVEYYDYIVCAERPRAVFCIHGDGAPAHVIATCSEELLSKRPDALERTAELYVSRCDYRLYEELPHHPMIEKSLDSYEERHGLRPILRWRTKAWRVLSYSVDSLFVIE